MDLVINHMSDAILLVGSDGKIITANHRLGELLRVNVAELPGHDFEPMDLWSRLDLLKPDIFEQRMALLSQSPQQSLQEQFESRDGCHLFQVIPVLDEQRARIGHLWIVQDFSAQTRGKQLLERQEAQLRALRRVGRHLQASQGLDATLHRIVEDLNKIFEVEAVGLVLRTPHGATRNRHLLWLDPHQTTLADGLLLRDLISEHLMPQVLPNRSTTFFPDVLQHGAWGRGLWNAGLETLAATAVISRDQSQGMIWIARRGGRPITDHHLNLLEALAPLLASAIDNASLREQLREHQLTDPLTDLPTARTIPLAIARQVHRPGHPWSVMVLELDHFAQMIAALGHEAGDAALRRVAQTLRRILRSTDHIARQEPDRFVIICPDIERHHAAHLADRLRAAIASESLSEPGSPPVRLTCSVGVAGSPADHHEGRTLEIAHARLRAAQAAGRNRVESMAQAR
jgi:diguanylate cyclase (GGDEF)-like protein